jgi:prepilin-type N-terminal cleavage/methylation domain-containing protein
MRNSFTLIEPPGVREGFTLIELLVVITMIVVLMALLTPALDKAIFEAEMAVDLANMRGVGAAATVYAMDHKRHYPYRDDVQGTDASQGTPVQNSVGTSPRAFSSPNNIRDVRGDIGYDMRQRMREYWGLNQLVGCPFSKAVDLADEGSSGRTLISADYSVFAGWQYRDRRGLFKVGDRMEIGSREFVTILVGDVDSFDMANNLSWASHPDDQAVLGEMVWQNFGDAGKGDPQAAAAAYGALVSDPGLSWTWSRWDTRAGGTATWFRGSIDDNFAFADGSAKRYDDVRLDPDTQSPDDRFVLGWYYRTRNSTRLILPGN